VIGSQYFTGGADEIPVPCVVLLPSLKVLTDTNAFLTFFIQLAKVSADRKQRESEKTKSESGSSYLHFILC
jgi:hypothetical protein